MKSRRLLSGIMGFGVLILTVITMAGCGRDQTVSQTKQVETDRTPENLPEKTIFRLHGDTVLGAHSKKTGLRGCVLHHDEHPRTRVVKETVEFEVQDVAVEVKTEYETDNCSRKRKDVVYSLESRGGFKLKARCSGLSYFNCENNHWLFLPEMEKVERSFQIELPEPIEIE